MRLDTIAVYGVPIGAGALCAALLLGPGAGRPVEGVRVAALVAEGASQTALRLTTRRHRDEVRAPVDLDGLAVELSSDGQTLGRWSGATGPRGHADAVLRLDPPASGELGVVVRHHGEILGTGRTRTVAPLAAEPREPTRVEAPWPMFVWLPRGRAVPEIAEPFVVSAETGADAHPELSVEARGGHVEIPEPERTCEQRCTHRWRLSVTATATTTQLVVTMELADRKARWEGAIALAPGAIWLEPHDGGDALAVRSPVPRSAAFVTLLSRHGRIWGERVALEDTPRGFADGRLALPGELPDGPLTAVVASDPREPPAGTVRWPLHPTRGTIAGGDAEVVVDSLPAAIEQERQRREAVRRPVYGLILAAALFELLFLAHKARVSGRALRRHVDTELAPASGARIERRTPLWWLSLLAFALVLAFVVLAGVAAFVG